ncbi:LytR/AlgR family response regulator transcription factor [Salibacter halophilus]|nr:LytTR family DNA-binding domain-containing protein [Salibacter halophilus]
MKKWPMIIAISIFIGLFLMVFEPFGLQFIEMEYKALFLFGYGVVTFCFMVLNLIIIPKIFPRHFAEKNWTVKRHIIWLVIDVVMIAAGNYLYSVWVGFFSWAGIEGFLIFLGFTIPIGLFPAVITTFIQQNINLKRNLAGSDEINTSISHKKDHTETNSTLDLTAGNQTYSFHYEQIIFIESEGNYVKVHYRDGEEVKREMIRSTMKGVEDLISNEVLFRCHRAFIVNLDYVQKVEGNSQGFTLQLEFSNDQIPVSRSYTKPFKKAMIRFSDRNGLG